ncbi:MAG: type II toxin-antitoxin system PemK/MazF family toxin [Gemmatimonadetes bacterium]|nr:type II toxin-antitoxin system PemK/MazF family toxin [Gemmatimonadota bacterium]MXY82320.1 type II toxin-antitoxin system PemK/MazF family toxin [Gemmatimonadota bacterium]MYB67368.1 type II toxin-antitoxin system PemK/MazF family toxin [Gemmatimonadota bacterium]
MGADVLHAKRRKALVLSDAVFNRKNASSLLMMITSAARSAWHLDVSLEQWSQAGLRKPCLARMKLFTLDNGLILGRVGSLTAEDQQRVTQALRAALPV